MSKKEQSWEVFDESLSFAGLIYGAQRVRMVVIGLGNGELLVVSPGVPLTDECWEQLRRFGTPKYLLAPNHFHTLGLGPWQERFPNALLVAHPKAHARLRKKVPGHTIHDLSVLEGKLPAAIRLFSPPMAKQGETWLSIKTAQGTAWFVTDGILNESRLPKGAFGLLMKLLGFKTELITNPFFKRVFLTDKAAYKAWVCAELDRDPPMVFIPSHGSILRGAEVASRLRQVTEVA